MARPDDESPEAGSAADAADASWRDRALERSLRAARAKAISRSDRFIQTAMELLEETGRSDFTVQELVDRSRTSLRSFYQYFAGKDELMVAILEERMARSAAAWREEVKDKETLEALRIVISRIYGASQEEKSSTSLVRAMALHHMALVNTHLGDYQRALAPLARLIRDLVTQGIDEGVLRSDLPADELVLVVFQAVLGAAQLNVFRIDDSDLGAHADIFWDFCRVGLVGTADGTPARSARPAARKAARRS